jgi:uncharacterized protein
MRRRIWLGGVFGFVVLVSISRALGAETPAVSSHEQAARELYDLVGGAKAVEMGAEAMLAVVRKQPEMAPYEDVFRSWYKKVFADGELEREVPKLYVASFTEEDLRGLMAFYRTPLGQKALTRMPELMKQAAELGAQIAQKHQGELKEMLEQARHEHESAKEQAPENADGKTPPH